MIKVESERIETYKGTNTVYAHLQLAEAVRNDVKVHYAQKRMDAFTDGGELCFVLVGASSARPRLFFKSTRFLIICLSL